MILSFYKYKPWSYPLPHQTKFLAFFSLLQTQTRLLARSQAKMLSWSPPLFSPFEWPLEDSISISHDQNIFFSREIETNSNSPSFLHSPPPPLSHEPLVEINGEFKHSNVDECDGGITTTTTAKKLNHNANERNRRKRINDLYSSLRSLLPATDQTVWTRF